VTNTAANVHKTTTTPQLLDRTANVLRVTVTVTPKPIPQSEVKQTTTATTTATATDPNNTITTAEQQYNKARTVEREEEERGIEMQDGLGK
jgi:hypothetical protein